MRRLVAIAALVGGAALGVAKADGPADADLRWASYPHHPPELTGESVSVDGQERTLAYFLTADDPITVAEWYEARWGAVGFRTHRSVEGAVTADDGNERRTVVATEEEGRTVVVLSRRILANRPASVSIPVPAGCEPVHHSASRDPTAQREFLTLRCPMDGAALLDGFEEAWGVATERLIEGPRGFARFDGGGDGSLL
ncbi:MAG: hypothetical protein AAFX94_03360, partial [Myxococcota bacterium]